MADDEREFRRRTDVVQLVVVLAIMGIVVVGMLVWSKRMGWW